MPLMPTAVLRRAWRAAALPCLLAALAATPALAAPGDQPVPTPPASKVRDNPQNLRTTSLPAKGLFVGDQLSDSAKARLAELVVEALGLQVQVAVVVPVGPWTIDGAQHTDTDLNKARLDAIRKFLAQRGVPAQRIFVESQIDAKVKEPRLDVQLVGTPKQD